MPRQLQAMPGVEPIGAFMIETFAPPMNHVRRSRDFAARLGLVPRIHFSGGKQRLCKTPKMGQRNIRRMLVTGAVAVTRYLCSGDAVSAGELVRCAIHSVNHGPRNLGIP